MTTDNQTSRALYAIHNPTSTEPAFVLPVFTWPGGDNDLHVQLLGPDAEVAGFQRLGEPLSVQHIDKNLTIAVGQPAIHAFQWSKEQVLIGNRDALAPDLLGLIHSPELLSLPLLRLQVLQFCELRDLIPQAATSAYTHVSAVSDYSAKFWRDQLLLTPITRRTLLKVCADLVGSDLAMSFDWSLASIRTTPQQLVLKIDTVLVDILNRRAGWQIEVLRELQPYILSFRLPNRLSIDTTSDLEQPTPPLRKRQSPPPIDEKRPSTAPFVVCAFGRRAQSAAREINRLTGSRIINSDGNPLLGAKLLRDTLKEGAVAATSNRVIIIFDATTGDTAAAQECGDLLQPEIEALGVVIYPVQEGIPNISENELLSSSGIKGVVIVPYSAVPTGDGGGVSSIGMIAGSLLRLIDRLSDEGTPPSLAGISVFSRGWTRFGVRDTEQALARAVASGANPWVPISRAQTNQIVVASVGRPDQDNLQRSFRQIVSPSDENRSIIEILWHRRAFRPNAPTPTTISVLASQITPLSTRPPGQLLQAAELVLRSFGNRLERSTAYSQVGYLHAFDSRGGSVYIADEEATLPFLTWDDQPFIRLANDRNAQRARLKDDSWKRHLPLTLNDLYFIRPEYDVRWTANYLARYAHPKQRLGEAMNDIVDQAIRLELTSSPERYELYSKLSELSANTQLSHTQSEIASVVRLPGRRLRIEGTLQVGVDLEYGGRDDRTHISDTYDGTFSAEAGPEGLEILSANVDTSSFYR